ncbi:MAG: MAPEG family protein [Gammaproteobacteria bacterium]|nr:MAPEG family protein [Gammaproteobacteria bacterium]
MNILYPIFALVAFTFVLIPIFGIARINAVRTGKVSVRYFKLMDGSEQLPEFIVKSGRHFTNLFEMPVLFYLLGVLMLIFKLDQPGMIILAWLYVVARLVHALIHLSYNNILHRMIAFMAGNFILGCLWIWVGLGLL